MKFKRIEYTAANRVGTICLNRPEKRNALDDTMVAELTDAFVAAAKDTNVKAIVLRAAGPVFSAGADLDYLEQISTADFETNLKDCRSLVRLLSSINQMKKPVIAVVEGPALAGGLALISACDLIIADDTKAQFGCPEVRIGFIPAVLLVYLLRRVSEAHGRELVLSGNPITARRAHEIGLINELVPSEGLDAFVEEYVRHLLEENSGTSMGLVKEMFAKLTGLNLVDQLDYAANMNAVARMTDDWKKGVSAFLRKERITW